MLLLLREEHVGDTVHVYGTNIYGEPMCGLHMSQKQWEILKEKVIFNSNLFSDMGIEIKFKEEENGTDNTH